MLDINKIRGMMADYLSTNAAHRHSIDAAIMHVVEHAYNKGMSDAIDSHRMNSEIRGKDD
jgi:hypothetical protein